MGIEADELTFFMVNSGPESYIKYPNGDEVYYVEVIFRCGKYHGEPKRQPEELEELRFFKPEEITLDMISPPIRPVFRRYLTERGIKTSEGTSRLRREMTDRNNPKEQTR